MNITQASIHKKQWFKAVLALFATTVFLALSFAPFIVQKTTTNIPGVSQSGSQYSSPLFAKADASMLAYGCRGLGYNMNDPVNWGQNFVDTSLDDKTNRLFTIHQAFGNSLRFVLYYGEGDGENFIAAKEEKQPDFVTVEQGRLENERSFESCLIGRIPIALSNVGFTVADSIVLISQFIVGLAFDPNLVCDVDSEGTDSCLDLVSIIGGKNDSDSNSILGSLTNSVYFPLLAIAALFTGVLLFYQGVVKRQIRQGFFGLMYCLIVTILGGAMLLNPTMLTKAPMTVASTASSCILGAFGGENCMGESSEGLDTNSFTGTNSSKEVCKSDVSGADFGDKMQTSVDGTMCQIWKAFVLEPYSVAQFGVPFSELDTRDSSTKGSQFVAASTANPNDFCVNLSSTASAGSMRNGTLELNSSKGQVCNIAAYQLYLMTNAKSGGDQLPKSGEIDERWYRIIEVAGNNDSMWNAWTSNAMGKLANSAISVLVSAAGAFILLVTGAYALVYYVSGIILVAFAPIFLLVGIHPGRGKRIMLGWLEKIVSNILKYVISAAFVVVTIAIYGGVLSTNSNLGMTVIFVFIITVALFMYRKEFTEMLGRANMGGEQLSNSLSERIAGTSRRMADNGRSLAMSGVGGAIGAKIAGGTALGGFKQGAKRNLKMGQGVTANAAREYDNIKLDNKDKLAKQVARRKEQKDFDSRERYSDSVDWAKQYTDNQGNFTPTPVNNGNPGNFAGGGNTGNNANGGNTGNFGNAGNGANSVDNANMREQRVQASNDKQNQWDKFEVDMKNANMEFVHDDVLINGLADIIQAENPDMSREESMIQAENSIAMTSQSNKLDMESARLSGEIAFDRKNGIEHGEKVERLAEIKQEKQQINSNLSNSVATMINNETRKAVQDGDISVVAPHLMGEKAELDKIVDSMSYPEAQTFDNIKSVKSEVIDLENLVHYAESVGDKETALSAKRDLGSAQQELNSMINSGDMTNNVSEAVKINDKIVEETVNPMKEAARDSYHHEKIVTENRLEEEVNVPPQPTNNQPVGNQFATNQFVNNQNTNSQPANNQPVSNESFSSQPVNNQNTGAQFTNVQNVNSQPVNSENTRAQNVNSESTSNQPVNNQNTTQAAPIPTPTPNPIPQREYTQEEVANKRKKEERERKLDIEVENSEDILSSIDNPGSGVSRGQIRKARKKAARQLADEGFIDGGKRDIKAYARERSRNDVRGVNLDKETGKKQDWSKFKPNKGK